VAGGGGGHGQCCSMSMCGGQTQGPKMAGSLFDDELKEKWREPSCLASRSLTRSLHLPLSTLSPQTQISTDLPISTSTLHHQLHTIAIAAADDDDLLIASPSSFACQPSICAHKFSIYFRRIASIFRIYYCSS